MTDNAKISKLLAVFNTLDETNKDIVVQVSETLTEKYGIKEGKNMSKIVSKSNGKKDEQEQGIT
jgi:hypothetical protein